MVTVKTSSLKPNKAATHMLVPETMMDSSYITKHAPQVTVGNQVMRCVYGVVRTKVHVTRCGIFCNKKPGEGDLEVPAKEITDRDISGVTVVLRGPYELSITDDRAVRFTLRSAS